MKKCFKCNQTKDLEEFYNHSKMPDGKLNKCRVCTIKDTKAAYKNRNKEEMRLARRKYKKRNKTVHKSWELKRKYGISIEQYETMMINQKGLCAICSKPGILVIDHDHETGKVRGLLHRNCNSGLGLFQDDFAILLGAAKYIQEHKGIT